MPAVLERCVQEVMGKGRDESSAYGICRTALGLMSDGSEDSFASEVTDAQMQARVDMALRFQNGPTVIKEMLIARPIGAFVNGDQEGNLNDKYLSGLVANFKKYPRQVPVFLDSPFGPAGGHPERNDEDIPYGWVEKIWQDSEGNLQGKVKLHGLGAEVVAQDLVRGASIATVDGKDYQGKPIGPVLSHLLLTNTPYIKDMNIAAATSRHQGGEKVAFFFTALPTREADMADEKGKKKPPEEQDGGAGGDLSLQERVDAQEGIIRELQAKLQDANDSNEALLAELKERREAKDTEILLKEKRLLARQVDAMKIRELVSVGLNETGQFRRDQVIGYEGGSERSDEATIAWFRTSVFGGDMKMLKFALKTWPKVSLRKNYHGGGIPQEAASGEFTSEEKESFEKAGKDVAVMEATKGARNFTEYKRLKKQAGKGA